MTPVPEETSSEKSPGGERGSEPVRLHFVIPSDLLHRREVQNAILKVCREFDYDEDAFFAVKLALDEAVTNAIKHGNEQREDKEVEVHAAVTGDKVKISVRNEGPGFERQHIPNPTLAENLDKCSGRGLLLIEAYMSDVFWSEDGKTITMTRHNNSEPPRIPE